MDALWVIWKWMSLQKYFEGDLDLFENIAD